MKGWVTSGHGRYRAMRSDCGQYEITNSGKRGSNSYMLSIAGENKSFSESIAMGDYKYIMKTYKERQSYE